MDEKKHVEYMCRYCGKRVTIGSNSGRPMHGVCPRKSKGGPHSWGRY